MYIGIFKTRRKDKTTLYLHIWKYYFYNLSFYVRIQKKKTIRLPILEIFMKMLYHQCAELLTGLEVFFLHI